MFHRLRDTTNSTTLQSVQRLLDFELLASIVSSASDSLRLGKARENIARNKDMAQEELEILFRSTVWKLFVLVKYRFI